MAKEQCPITYRQILVDRIGRHFCNRQKFLLPHKQAKFLIDSPAALARKRTKNTVRVLCMPTQHTKTVLRSCVEKQVHLLTTVQYSSLAKDRYGRVQAGNRPHKSDVINRERSCSMFSIKPCAGTPVCVHGPFRKSSYEKCKNKMTPRLFPCQSTTHYTTVSSVVQHTIG